MFSVHDTQHNDNYHNDNQHKRLRNDIDPNNTGIMLNVAVMSVVMLNVILLSVVMLNVVMLSVVAPCFRWSVFNEASPNAD